MKIKNLKFNTKKINVKKIDMDRLSESLFICVADAKKNCKAIDEAVMKMTTLSFVPWINTVDQYAEVIEKIAIKHQLMTVYKLFVQWAKKLTDKQKRCYIAYFVKKDKALCAKVAKTSHYYKQYILPMERSFIKHFFFSTNMDKEQLISNPFVNAAYMTPLKGKRNRKFNKTKKGRKV